MRLKELKAELEATRKKIDEQLSMVGRSIQSIDPTLYDKERVLEQVIAMWRAEFAHAPSHSAREHWNANKEVEIEEQATSNCKKCRVAIKNGGDWGYCTCCYEETRAQEEEEDGTD